MDYEQQVRSASGRDVRPSWTRRGSGRRRRAEPPGATILHLFHNIREPVQPYRHDSRLAGRERAAADDRVQIAITADKGDTDAYHRRHCQTAVGGQASRGQDRSTTASAGAVVFRRAV
jgi:hypothetical protein